MITKDLPPDLELALRNALKHGFCYVVATYKRCVLGKPRVILLFCDSMLTCQEFITHSEYRDSLSFNHVEVVLNSPAFFVRNR